MASFVAATVTLLAVHAVEETGWLLKRTANGKSQVAEICYQTTAVFHARVDRNVPKGSVIFLGDSITQGLCGTAVVPGAVNLGIGTDTTTGVLKRIRQYRSVKQASVVVLEIGLNDISVGRTNNEIGNTYRLILEQVPPIAAIVMSAVLPVDEKSLGESGKWRTNDRIRSLNAAIAEICQARGGCFWTSTESLTDSRGNLATVYHEGDGVHLSQLGYAVWIEELKKSVDRAILWHTQQNQPRT